MEVDYVYVHEFYMLRRSSLSHWPTHIIFSPLTCTPHHMDDTSSNDSVMAAKQVIKFASFNVTSQVLTYHCTLSPRPVHMG